MMYNKWMMAAAALMVVTVCVHIFAGGPEILTPTRASALDDVVIATLSVVWHGITVFLIVAAAALFWLARHPNMALSVAIGGIQLGFAGLFIWYAITDLGVLFGLPQWTIFTAIPALMGVGVWTERGEAA